MQTKDYLQKLVDYVEDNVESVLTVDELASYCGFSRFYLHRLFSIYTGMSLSQYVRKRKLNYAMEALNSKRRIVDIAIDTGDALKFDLKRFKLEEVNLLRREDVEKLLEYLSDVRYVTLETMTVLSGTVYSGNPEDEIIEIMNALAGEIGLEPDRSFGFDSAVESELSAEDYRGYEFWLTVSDEDEEKFDDYSEVNAVAGELSYKGIKIAKKVIPSYRYVTLRITDPMDAPFERIPTGWKVLVKWLEDNKVDVNCFGQDDLVECLEEVREVEGILVMDVYIPIDKARAY